MARVFISNEWIHVDPTAIHTATTSGPHSQKYNPPGVIKDYWRLLITDTVLAMSSTVLLVPVSKFKYVLISIARVSHIIARLTVCVALCSSLVVGS
jgi:hypothetical protein